MQPVTVTAVDISICLALLGLLVIQEPIGVGR
jgi:hypothetical protein